MKLKPTYITKTISGRETLMGAFDEANRLWLCEVSNCGTFLEPVFGPVTGRTSFNSEVRNRTNDPYIIAGRDIIREYRSRTAA